MSDIILYVRSKEISVSESPELSGHHGYASTYRGSSGPVYDASCPARGKKTVAVK